MKTLTLRLGQFAIGGFIVTFLFRYILNLCIGIESVFATILCSIVYFFIMFLIGWYFGSKEAKETDIHDIGFRFHLVTFILCIGIGFISYHIGWNTESLISMKIAAISWGIGLLIHFFFYIIAQKNSIKGYAKDEIFE